MSENVLSSLEEGEFFKPSIEEVFFRKKSPKEEKNVERMDEVIGESNWIFFFNQPKICKCFYLSLLKILV